MVLPAHLRPVGKGGTFGKWEWEKYAVHFFGVNLLRNKQSTLHTIEDKLLHAAEVVNKKKAAFVVLHCFAWGENETISELNVGNVKTSTKTNGGEVFGVETSNVAQNGGNWKLISN